MSRLRYLLDLLEGKRSRFDYLQPGHSPQGEELRGRGVLRLADGGGEDKGREGEVHLVKPHSPAGPSRSSAENMGAVGHVVITLLFTLKNTQCT